MFPNGNIGMKRMDILITFQAFKKDWMALLKYFKHHETTSTFATYYYVFTVLDLYYYCCVTLISSSAFVAHDTMTLNSGSPLGLLSSVYRT